MATRGALLPSRHNNSPPLWEARGICGDARGVAAVWPARVLQRGQAATLIFVAMGPPCPSPSGGLAGAPNVPNEGGQAPAAAAAR